MAVYILVSCPAIKSTDAQNQSRKSEVRIVHFPEDRSLGRLYIQDTKPFRKLSYWFHWTGTGEAEWEFLSEATGEIQIPAGKHLALMVNRNAWKDLSPLTQLKPDDLYKLSLPALSTDPVKASDECMLHIARLTGLKILILGQTDITDRGIKTITNLKSLERLEIPPRVTDRGMADIAMLRSLKGLYFTAGGSLVTDIGLHHLRKLTSLEELYLRGERMSDTGLAHLRELPRLEYLCLFGSRFTDRGIVHIKTIPTLRVLSFHEHLCRITDRGLVHLSKMPKLEILCLHAMRNITDNGLRHLSKLRSLKKLNIGSSQVTDRGLAYVSQIRTLERLDLPQDQKGITDEGLKHLGTLPNLKHLSISRIHFNDPRLNREYYTDEGLAELIHCRLLEELKIGSIGITDAGIDHLLQLKNLKMLMLFGCDNVTEKGFAKLIALKSLQSLYVTGMSVAGLNRLESMPNLTKLTVKDMPRNGATLDLSGLTALEEIGLSFHPRFGEAFSDVDLKCLTGLKRIRWLQIGPRNYTDEGLAHLAGLTNMERLNIGGSKLTDQSLQYLTGMKKLNHLSILGGYDTAQRAYGSSGDITDEGLRQLETFKQLSYLDINSRNDFSDAALRRLWRQLPNLSMLRINGGMLLNIGDGYR